MLRGSADSWIGLYKYSQQSQDPSPSAQYWLDGSTSTFRRWFPGDPNSDTTYCIRMLAGIGNFADKGCYEDIGFVCKITGGV